MLNFENNEVECCEESCVHCGVVKKVKCQMPKEEKIERMADFFKAFSDKTRISILLALSNQEMCVCDIAELLSMTQSAISHQLRFLKQSRLVKNRKDGKTVYYSLADKHIENILETGVEHVSEE